MKNIKIKSKNGAKLKGHYRFTLATIETPYQRWLNSRIETLRKKGQPFLHLVERLNEVCQIQVFEFDNLITTVGMTLITNNLTDSTPTNDMRINYCALGTGTDVPALGDTKLQTEVFRNAVASQTNAGAIAYASMFVSATDDADTYKEFGLFTDASSTPDNGVLFSRTAINITKSSIQTLSIDYSVSLSNV
jgi:hypothetical protein